jgi:hypothetical protein
MKILAITILVSPALFTCILIILHIIVMRGRRSRHEYFQPWEKSFLYGMDQYTKELDDTELLNTFFALEFAIKEGLAEDGDIPIRNSLRKAIEKRGLITTV